MRIRWQTLLNSEQVLASQAAKLYSRPTAQKLKSAWLRVLALLHSSRVLTFVIAGDQDNLFALQTWQRTVPQ